MEGESNEWQRRIDELRKQIAVLKAVAEADKETRRAEMSAMKSDLAETLTRFEAGYKTAIARLETKAAEDRAESKQENEKLRTEIEKNSKWQVTIILAAIAVATGFLGWLQ